MLKATNYNKGIKNLVTKTKRLHKRSSCIEVNSTVVTPPLAQAASQFLMEDTDFQTNIHRLCICLTGLKRKALEFRKAKNNKNKC